MPVCFITFFHLRTKLMTLYSLVSVNILDFSPRYILTCRFKFNCDIGLFVCIPCFLYVSVLLNTIFRSLCRPVFFLFLCFFCQYGSILKWDFKFNCDIGLVS